MGDKASRVTLSTIHSFCHYLLRSEGIVFEVLTGKEQINFVRNLMKHKRLKDLSIGMIISEISLAKNNLIDVDEFRVLYEGDKTMLKVADIYESYDREKKKKFLLDFDDLLIETYHLLNDNQFIRDKYVDRYLHLLVDEFQDTNVVQVEILKSLTSNTNGQDRSFWICGDDAQSIFSFAGASVGNILNFERNFQGSKIFYSQSQLPLNSADCESMRKPDSTQHKKD